MQDMNAIKEEELCRKLQKMNKCPTNSPTNIPSNEISSFSLDNGEFISTIRKLLRCAVCLEDSKDVNQCKNGHLICQHCTHKLKLRLEPGDTQGKCPTCRIPLFPGISRCLLAVQLFAELPKTCIHCKLNIRQGDHENHQNNVCPERPVTCKFKIFGCQWKGRAADSKKHHSWCLVSKKSVRDVESIIRETFNQQAKISNHYLESWSETLNILSGHPLGAFIAVREAILFRVVRESRGSAFRFRGTTAELSLAGRSDTTVELTLCPDDLRLSYRTKFPPQGTHEMRFRLISIDCKEIFIPIIDKFRSPNVRNSHVWQEFRSHLDVPPDKRMSFPNIFSKLAEEKGPDFMVKAQFLVVFEMSYLVQTIDIDAQENNTSTSTTLRDTERSVINTNTNYENNPEIMSQTMLIDENQSHLENVGENEVDDASEADSSVSPSSDETIDEEYGSLSEDPPAVFMQNNNALTEKDIETNTTQSLSTSGKREPHSGNLKSRTLVSLKRRRGLRTAKTHNHYLSDIACLIETVTPYITRGHMWRNYEILSGNFSAAFRLRRSARRHNKSISGDSLLKVSLIELIIEKWSIFKKELIKIGWKKLGSILPCNKIENETKADESK
ncbi:unnamed protein product [Hymenolepis diminuta]|uniref:RING-type domain-containing protein n=1 Tax=Hymenolepis diminuta TaxID=6216 RepID=A0A564Z434_HYMDI|nr:unnamed protein product [Hymenolepis diminuta]